MFYYPTVLRRHTGCFSTIWLVATKGIKVPRRDFLKVNVKSTCDDIMDYLLEQVPPPRPDLPRPRFSLYLSSQLQYGLILVYHRQCAILLEEIQFVVGRLAKKAGSQTIDLDDHSRQALDFPDALSLLEEAQGALDPLFGVMLTQDPIPSPGILIQMGQEYLSETSPEHPDRTSPAAASPGLGTGLTASPEMITLRETEPVAIPVTEFEGVELIDQHPDTLDLLLAQTDHFAEGDLETPKEEAPPGEEEAPPREEEAPPGEEEAPPGEEERELERGGLEADLERERTKDLIGSTIDLQPTTLSAEDATMLPQEEPGLSVESPGPLTDQLTPVSVPVLPSPPSAAEGGRPAPQAEGVPPPEVKTRKRRRRQLIFFDPETQIKQEVLQQQINNPQTETRGPLLLPPPHHRMPSAAELFSNPCTILPDEVLSLWRQAATVTPVSGSDLLVGERGRESTDSEKEKEAAEREEEEVKRELSPQEVPRDVAESEMFEISVQGSLPLEGSDQREVSREISPMFTPERERSPVSRTVSTLQDIPEVLDERLDQEPPGLQPELNERDAAPVIFQSLLPPEADRQTVSNIFQRLLENLTARQLHAEQDEPYGDIVILPRRDLEEVL